jgi:hypothetical protein
VSCAMVGSGSPSVCAMSYLEIRLVSSDWTLTVTAGLPEQQYLSHRGVSTHVAAMMARGFSHRVVELSDKTRRLDAARC